MDAHAAAAAMAGQGFTAEQLAALGPMMMNPEMMAAAQAQMGMQQVGPDGQAMQAMGMMDPSQQQYFDPAAFPGGHMSMDWMQTLPADQLAAIMANPQFGQFFGGYGMGQYGGEQAWPMFDDKDAELMTELWQYFDKEYCRQKLGTEEIDFNKLSELLGRSPSVLREKFHLLKGMRASGMECESAMGPPNSC